MDNELFSRNNDRQYHAKSIIEPALVIEERKAIGLHPSFPAPQGAILCYDTAFWNWLTSLTDKIEYDGWLKGSFLVTHKDSNILVLKVPGFGAPTAVLSLEELIAFGITNFVSLGAAGGLQTNMNIGDIIVCDRAIRDEGTSNHYLPPEKYAASCRELNDKLSRFFMQNKIPYNTGASWTTDAPYRETVYDLRRYRKENVLTVEMEASALFAVGTYRRACVSAVFTISDLLTEEGWIQGYHSDEKLESLKRIFGAALESISSHSSPSPA